MSCLNSLSSVKSIHYYINNLGNLEKLRVKQPKFHRHEIFHQFATFKDLQLHIILYILEQIHDGEIVIQQKVPTPKSIVKTPKFQQLD